MATQKHIVENAPQEAHTVDTSHDQVTINLFGMLEVTGPAEIAVGVVTFAIILVGILYVIKKKIDKRIMKGK